MGWDGKFWVFGENALLKLNDPPNSAGRSTESNPDLNKNVVLDSLKEQELLLRKSLTESGYPPNG